MFDIAITGTTFFTISGVSSAGRDFMDKNVSGTMRGCAHSDDNGYTQDIAAGAIRAGLAVTLNGQEIILEKEGEGHDETPQAEAGPSHPGGA